MAAIGLQQAPRNAPVQRYNGTPASSGHAAIASQRNADACEQAKAERKAAYDRVGLNRSFAFSSHWDGVVQQACR